MAKKKEDKKLTKDQAEKKIQTLKKDLFNIRYKKVNNQIENVININGDLLKGCKKYAPYDIIIILGTLDIIKYFAVALWFFLFLLSLQQLFFVFQNHVL